MHFWTVETLQQGYPGKTTHHGGLGWSTIGLARDAEGRVAVLDTGGFAARHNILNGLAARGLKPEDVTDLLLTHLHHDHCINWPMFPNATLHVPGAELDWALSLPDGHLTVPELAVRALAASPRMLRFNAGDAVLPGVTTFPTPGHTPHHVAFVLDGAPSTIFSADAAKNRVELATGETDMTMDDAASRASIARLRAEWAARPGCRLLPGHDLPMLLAADGSAVPQGQFEAAIDSWFGATLAEKTRFSLVR